MPVSTARPAAGTAGENLASRAYQKLRAAILEGRMPPGTPISRRKWAAEMGMSAVPVAEAIVRLESEGLVESRPRAGTRVRLATAEEIHGNYVLREALETHSARLFAESASKADRQRLRRAAERLDAAFNKLAAQAGATSQGRAEVERAHVEFHMLIAKAANVPVLASAIARSRVLLLNSAFSGTAAFAPLPPRWHRDLAEALVSGSAGEAAEAMRSHVRYRQEEVIARFRELAAGPARMARGPQRGAPAGRARSSSAARLH